jgi:hypothetical protein
MAQVAVFNLPPTAEEVGYRITKLVATSPSATGAKTLVEVSISAWRLKLAPSNPELFEYESLKPTEPVRDIVPDRRQGTVIPEELGHAGRTLDDIGISRVLLADTGGVANAETLAVIETFPVSAVPVKTMVAAVAPAFTETELAVNPVPVVSIVNSDAISLEAAAS